MANMTKPIREQLADLGTAAADGLPADLKNFVDITTTMLWNCSENHFKLRKDLQAYVNTLGMLIDTAVNNPRHVVSEVSGFGTGKLRGRKAKIAEVVKKDRDPLPGVGAKGLKKPATKKVPKLLYSPRTGSIRRSKA